MKRRDLIRHLEAHGYQWLREGGQHSAYVNRAKHKISTVPRHREVDEFLVPECIGLLTAKEASPSPRSGSASSMVHEADLDDDKFATPEAAGLDAVIRGLGMIIEDDLELFTVTDRIFDGLYAWLKRTGPPA